MTRFIGIFQHNKVYIIIGSLFRQTQVKHCNFTAEIKIFILMRAEHFKIASWVWNVK